MQAETLGQTRPTPVGKARPTKFAKTGAAELRTKLTRALLRTAEEMAELAEIWYELETVRGEDLSELKEGLGQYLALIAAGKADPGAVARFPSSRYAFLLRTIVTLPIEEQRALGRGEAVQVWTRTTGGEYEQVEFDPRNLKASQIRQVFRAGAIRSAEEQRAQLGGHVKSAKLPVKFDPDLQAISIGKQQVSMRQITNAVAAESRPSEVAAGKRVPVQIPETLYRALRARAAEQNISPEEALTRALWASGIVE